MLRCEVRGVNRSGGKEVGLREGRERVLANLAPDRGDVGPERRMCYDAQPRDSVPELTDLDREVEVRTVRASGGGIQRDASRVA